jgi:hypothetical protein
VEWCPEVCTPTTMHDGSWQAFASVTLLNGMLSQNEQRMLLNGASSGTNRTRKVIGSLLQTIGCLLPTKCAAPSGSSGTPPMLVRRIRQLDHRHQGLEQLNKKTVRYTQMRRRVDDLVSH